MKVISVFGTRPEAIKMAPIVKTLANSDQIISRVCVTAQHRHMLDQVLSLFEIEPDYDLNVMKAGQSPTQVAAAILQGLTSILREEQPDWLLVQGDTTTVMAAAIGAFYAGVKVGHVEAGLRTYDKRQPFPEEINRRIASVTADVHFAPTATARQNLLQENIPADTVFVTGNPVIDALQWVANLSYQPETGPLAGIPGRRRLILVTAHRRENFGQPLENICQALRSLAEAYKDDVQIVYPVHLNPNVQKPVYQALGDISNITLLPPIEYLPFVYLLKNTHLVLTDSGGIQEEAPSLGKPVLVMREVTERPEAVEAGTVRLVGTDSSHIIETVRHLLDDPQAYQQMARAVNPYGDGRAAGRIKQALLKFG
ncbi:MAG: UDP-N-acetylglucosamine 2-epimerase (non-hydrolyzing) [Anaerolineae bacterium]|nr:UDP-N-acetylglucosamine 2-epimerase (non-hydrolyzing) [Anaerolineae bacterium]